MHIWTEKVIRPIRDELLVRSAREFRELLGYIERSKPSCQGHYIQEIQRGLRLMKEELARRDLDAEGLVPGTLPRQAALSGANQRPEATTQRERPHWEELVARPAPDSPKREGRRGDAPPRKREMSSVRPAVPS